MISHRLRAREHATRVLFLTPSFAISRPDYRLSIILIIVITDSIIRATILAVDIGGQPDVSRISRSFFSLEEEEEIKSKINRE